MLDKPLEDHRERVGTILPLYRSNKGKPGCCPVYAGNRLIGGLETFSGFAAPVTEPRSETA